uniref:Uncharacterized protein n=1 Tax=Anguilla anguilla TaxID=7936 RepID=A0A0E9TT17_ANGAN
MMPLGILYGFNVEQAKPQNLRKLDLVGFHFDTHSMLICEYRLWQKYVSCS